MTSLRNNPLLERPCSRGHVVALDGLETVLLSDRSILVSVKDGVILFPAELNYSLMLSITILMIRSIGELMDI
jgi:hypothetical protein